MHPFIIITHHPRMCSTAVSGENTKYKFAATVVTQNRQYYHAVHAVDASSLISTLYKKKPALHQRVVWIGESLGETVVDSENTL